MPVPIICLRHFVEKFGERFSKPQFKYFVTVLLGPMLYQEPRTLRGLLHQVDNGPKLPGLNRFLPEVPWQAEALVAVWLNCFLAPCRRVPLGCSRDR